jgi:hypothetical protein
MKGGGDVSIEIGSVVVEGASAAPRDGARFGRLTERSLGELLAERSAGEAWGSGRIEALSVSALDLPSGMSDERMADAVARAIAGALVDAGRRR